MRSLWNRWRYLRYLWRRWRNGPTQHDPSGPYFLRYRAAFPLTLSPLSLGVLNALYKGD